MGQNTGYQLALICFTAKGAVLCREIAEALKQDGFCCQGYIKRSKTEKGGSSEKGNAGQTDDGEYFGLEPVKEPLTEWAGKQFKQADGLIFIGAAGIAVRASARWIQDKFLDPAVVVVDEKGQFVIPILSGHVGGANKLAQRISRYIHGIPVITTATDIQGKFSVDMFAKEHNLFLSDRELAKKVSADILEGCAVGFFSDFPVTGSIPKGCIQTPGYRRKIVISVKNKEKNDWEETLYLVPRIVTIGIGCRRGIEKEKLREQILSCLREQGIFIQAVCQAATIDRKINEEALDELCREMGWPLFGFSVKELKSLEGKFSDSEFVEQTVGVGNVCERAAVFASRNQGGTLLLKKQVLEGATLALAVSDWQLDVEAKGQGACEP
ncbi:MAG: cobalt-precorrin 5A hydrolase [Lachnospiraceae bacterium]|jgi:cobalt-precorrin 5A hydrolase|nr:cobalt-precorrin 5A hydrolase [Lachnospiraceae bacterium]